MANGNLNFHTFFLALPFRQYQSSGQCFFGHAGHEFLYTAGMPFMFATLYIGEGEVGLVVESKQRADLVTTSHRPLIWSTS